MHTSMKRCGLASHYFRVVSIFGATVDNSFFATLVFST